MSELIMSGPLADLIRNNKIDEVDVLELRSTIYRDGVVNSQEATALLALDRSCQNKCAAWEDFYVESLGDYIVYQTEPRGHVSVANAEGLIRAISVDGIVDTKTELDLLMHVLRKAETVPAKLSAFALRQVSNAVLQGRGVLSNGRTTQPSYVTAEDVTRLRDVLSCVCTDEKLAITRDEANVLFDINDGTAVAANDPSWQVLFSKAVAACVMSVSTFNPMATDQAPGREIWMEGEGADVTTIIADVFAGGFSDFASRVASSNAIGENAASRTQARTQALSIAAVDDGEEAQWLAERIARDGRIHENEKQLLRLIATQAAQIPAPLQPLLAQVA